MHIEQHCQLLRYQHFLAYPNLKVEASKYRAGLALATHANLKAKMVVIDDAFPFTCWNIHLREDAKLIRASDGKSVGAEVELHDLKVRPRAWRSSSIPGWHDGPSKRSRDM